LYKVESRGTPLSCAIINNDLESFKTLIDLKAETNTLDGSLPFNATPLFLAARFADHKLINELLTLLPAELHRRNEFGETVLHEAAKTRNFEAIEEFIEKGVALDCLDNKGNTFIHILFAPSHMHRVPIEVLKLEKVMKKNNLYHLLNQKNIKEQTPLHLAALELNEEELEVLEKLLTWKADANITDNNGKPPAENVISQLILWEPGGKKPTNNIRFPLLPQLIALKKLEIFNKHGTKFNDEEWEIL